jgi:hypothetical protein
MKISKPEIVRENKQAIYRVQVEFAGDTKALWYSVDESFESLLSSLCDAPLVALLIPAMVSGEDIYVDGPLSERLFYNLSASMQSLLQCTNPSFHKVNIEAPHLCNDQARASGVATGFSGGIDSYSVLADHYATETPEGHKITHLLFNNVGSHGKGGEKLFHERYERLLPAAERMGLPFVMINSNLESFYSRDLEFHQTHTLRNASVAHALQNGIGRYMYASAYGYSDVFVGPTPYIAYTDTISLPLLSSDAVDLFSVGSQYNRVEKTLGVAEFVDSYKSLDVCVAFHNDNGYANCSACWKCLRTLATLEIGGYLDRYSEAFDLNTYKQHRDQYFSTLLDSSDSFSREIVDFAKERNFSFPASSRVTHLLGLNSKREQWRRIKSSIKGLLKP